MSAKSLLSHQTAPPLGGMPTVESQKWNRDLSAEWQISSEDESLYDEFEAEGFTREELKAINAIAPLGQKLQDAALLNGLEEVDDMRMEATRDLNGLGTVGEGREGEKREGGRKKKRKKGGELSVQEGKEQDTHRVNQEAGNPAAKHERRAKRNSNTEEPERPPKRKKTAAELEQEHWRKIERPPRDNKKDQEKQDHIAAIDDEIRGTRDFANAKQLEIYEHGGMPEIDKQMKQDLEEMKRERDTLRDGEELNKRNRKKRKSAVRDDVPQAGVAQQQQREDAFSTTDEAADLTPAAKAPSPSPYAPSTNTRSSRRHKKPPPSPPQPTSPPVPTLPPPPTTQQTARKARRSSTKKSPYFPSTTTTISKQNPPRQSRKSISCIPHPPLSSPTFGLAQERLHHTPFNLLLACVFLTKTRGAVSIPVFYRFISRYPTPVTLASASTEDVVPWFEKLGLQNQRAKRVVGMARAWVVEEPRRGRRWVVGRKKGEWLGDEDDEKENGARGEKEGAGGGGEKEGGKVVEAYEIAHIPGIGAYGLDSWRIFCRDDLRGITTGEDGRNTQRQPEWQRVLPLDKELRAYLRWRWLKEGWVWDPLSGGKRRASPQEMERAEGGGVMVEGDDREGEGGKGKGLDGVVDGEAVGI